MGRRIQRKIPDKPYRHELEGDRQRRIKQTEGEQPFCRLLACSRIEAGGAENREGDADCPGQRQLGGQCP